MTSCTGKDRFYINEKFILVDSNEDPSDTKYHNPNDVKIWLIKRMKGSNQYAELRNDETPHEELQLTNNLWYNTEVGDTLVLIKIKKSRFFFVKQ